MKSRTAGKRVIIGIAALGLAVLAQRAFGTKVFVLDGVFLALAGALCLRYALAGEAGRRDGETAPIRWRPSGQTLVLAGAALLLNAAALVTLRGAIIPVYGVGLVLASVGLFVAAAVQLDRDRAIPPAARTLATWELVAVGGLTVLAAALRFFALDQLPYGVWYDESNTALRVQEVFGRGEWRVFFSEDVFRPVHMYSYALAMALFGPTVWAIRVPEAVAGVLSVPAFFLVGRRLFGPHVGIVAAALVATARWHLTFSRIAFDGIWVPLCIALAVYFAARAVERRSATDFTLSGLVVGFGLYSYIPFRIFPLILAVFVIHLAVSYRRAIVERLGGLAVLGVAALLVASPLLFFAVTHPKEFGARTESASVFSNKSPEAAQAALIENVRKHLLMFNVQGDPNGRHNIPGEPMLDPLSAGLFAIGLGYALFRLYRPVYAFLILNFLVLMLGGVLSVDFEAPQSLRSIGVMASVYLLAAVPLGRVWELLSPRRVGSGQPAAVGRQPAAISFPQPGAVPALSFLGRVRGRMPATLAFATRAGSLAGSSESARGLAPTSPLAATEGKDVSSSLPPLETLPAAPPHPAPRRSRRGPLWLQAVPAALVGIGLLAIAQQNIAGYFVRQANHFSSWAVHSAAETVIGYRLRNVPAGQADIFVSTLYNGHPTVRFLAPNAPPYASFEAGTTLPLRTQKEEVLIFLEPQQRAPYDQLRAYYPTGEFEEVQLPGGSSPVLLAARLTRPVLASIQGLEARVFAGSEATGAPAARQRLTSLDVTWSTLVPLLQPPFAVELDGTLFAPRYGRYALSAEGVPMELEIDGAPVFRQGQATGEVILARGNHTFRGLAKITEAGARTQLFWQPPGEGRQLLPANNLYVPPVTASGLLGRYYPNPEWSGTPALEQIDPMLAFYFHLVPLPRPYSVEWVGKLYAPADGVYQFGVEQISLAQLFVDDKPLVDNREHNVYRQAATTLTKGYHDLKVRFIDRDSYSHIYLSWQPPGRGRELIPAAYLLPPMQSYPDVPIALKFAPPPPPPPVASGPAPGARPAPGAPAAKPGPAGQAPSLPPPTAVKPDLVIGGSGNGEGQFASPRDVTVAADGSIFVADTGNMRIQKFDASGKFLLAWGREGEGDGEFAEPLAVVLNRAGEVLVLDAKGGWIQRFDPNGRFLGKMAGPSAALYNPRGLAIDGADNLFISDTGGARVVMLGPDGNIVRSIGAKGGGPGQLLEPTDVLVLPDGQMVVLDTGNDRLQRLDAEGKFLSEWYVGKNVAAEGPHLAQAPDGSVYISDPERHRIIQFDVGFNPRAVFGSEGSEPGQFRKPVGIGVDRQGAIYVVDTFNHRIQRIRP